MSLHNLRLPRIHISFRGRLGCGGEASEVWGGGGKEGGSCLCKLCCRITARQVWAPADGRCFLSVKDV